jgi:hypothetical protein
VPTVASGKGTKLCGGELVLIGVDAASFSCTVEQAGSDTRAAAARHAIMSFFIGNFFLYCSFTILTYAVSG